MLCFATVYIRKKADTMQALLCTISALFVLPLWDFLPITLVYFSPLSCKKRSASMAALAPLPAATTP